MNGVWTLAVLALAVFTIVGAFSQTRAPLGQARIYAYHSKLSAGDLLSSQTTSAKITLASLGKDEFRVLVTNYESANENQASETDSPFSHEDLEGWFSFACNSDGTVSGVQYERGVSAGAVDFLKTIASMFNANIQTQNQSHSAFEVDHMGGHLAEYSVNQDGNALSIERTVREKDEIFIGEEQKTLYLNPQNKTIVKIKLDQYLRLLKTGGLNVNLPLLFSSADLIENGVFPNLDSIQYHAELTLEETRGDSPTQQRPENLISDSLQVKKVRKEEIQLLKEMADKLKDPTLSVEDTLDCLKIIATSGQGDTALVAAIEKLAYGKMPKYSGRVEKQAWLSLGSLAHSMHPSQPKISIAIVKAIANELKRTSKDFLKSVTLVDSLGNAGLEEGLGMILSLVNGSVLGRPQLRRAAVQALRKYKCFRSADTLKATALLDPDASVRKAAAFFYSLHPQKEDDWTFEGEEFIENGTKQSSPIHHSVRRRAIPDLVPSQHEFKLSTPAVQWHKRLGTDNIGADFGTSTSGKMEVKMDPWTADFKADLQTKSWVNAKVGYLGQEVNLLEINMCFNGDFEYDTNVLKDYDMRKFQDDVNQFDVISKPLLTSIHLSATNLAKHLAAISKAGSLPALFDDVGVAVAKFVPALESLERKLTDAFSQIQLYSGLALVGSARDVLQQFKALQGRTSSIVMNVYSAAFSGAFVDLPHAAHEIDTALTEIQKLLTTFASSPQKTLDAMAHTNLRIEAAIEVAKTVKAALDVVCSASADDCSSWLDISSSTSLLEEAAKLLAVQFQAQAPADSDLAKYAATDLLVYQQEQQAYKTLQKTFDTLLPSALVDFSATFAEFRAAYTSLQHIIAEAESGYTGLRKSYESARTEVSSIFGVKFHPSFPRVFRVCNDSCGCGVYPATTGSRYEHGIDLKTKNNEKIGAPFAGVIQLVNGSTIRLLPTDFSLSNYEVLLSNVVPVSSVTTSSRLATAGESIGTASGPQDCGVDSFIHISVKKRKSADSDDDLFVDPSIFVRSPDFPKVTPTVECNDGTVLFRGQVVERFMPIAEPALQVIEKPLKRAVEETTFDDVKQSFGGVVPRGPSDVEKAMSGLLTVFDWRKSSAKLRSWYPTAWSDPVSVVLPSTFSGVDALNVTEVEAVLGKANAVSSLDVLKGAVSQLEAKILTDTCADVNYMTSAEIQDWLKERGLSTDGSRYEMAQRLRQVPSSGCSAIESGLPADSSVVYSIENDCRGISACLPLQYGYASIPTLFSVSYDSCKDELTLQTGNGWLKVAKNASSLGNSSYAVASVSAHNAQLYLQVAAELSGSDLSVNVQAQMCNPNSLDCSPEVAVTQGLRFFTDCRPGSPPPDAGVRSLTLHQLIGKLLDRGFKTEPITKIFESLASAAVYQAENSQPELDASFETDFPPIKDLVLVGRRNFTRSDVEFFKYRTSFTIGATSSPLAFDFSANGSYSALIDIRYSALEKQLTSSVTTGITANMQGYTRSGNLKYEEISVTGKLIEAKYPTTTKLSFNTWPLEISTDMHLTLVPTDLVLSTKVIRESVATKKAVYSKDIWNFQTPPLDYSAFSYKTQRSDTTPPAVLPLFSADPTAVATTSAECFVRQLPGRHHWNPAYEISGCLSDDLGRLKAFFFIGTHAGGSDVAGRRRLGGSTVTSTESLVNGKRLYFTLEAENQQGLKTYATCELPTYDTTLPSGWIRPSHLISSHPSFLRAMIMVDDDSELKDVQQQAFGVGSGLYEETEWTDLPSSVFRTEIDGSVQPLNAFGFPQAGSKASTPFQVFSSVSSASDCARKCVDSRCKAFDFSGADSLCLLHESALGVGEELMSAADAEHYTRIGVGNTAQLEHSGGVLEHNRLYHFSVKITNRLGYSSVLSSSPVLVDLTPPSPGRIMNAAANSAQVDRCSAAVNQPCINPSSLANHRIVTDGSGSETVFWGHSALRESAFTTATHYASVNWIGFHDNETGIWGYTWCIGSSVGSCDVYAAKDPQIGERLLSDLTHVAVASVILVPGKLYYVTVQALNQVVHGGALVTSVRHSVPLVVDVTAPELRDVTVDRFDQTTGDLSFTFNASDGQSGIKEVYFGLGKTPGDVDVLSWRRIDNLALSHSTVVGLTKGERAYLRVKAVNNVDLTSTAYDGNGIIIPEDVRLPAGVVLDGKSDADDVDFISPWDPVCVHWKSFTSEQLRIINYVVDVGTSAGLHDENRTVASPGAEMMCYSTLSLAVNVTYFFTVTANYEGGQLNSSSSSDGFLIDSTPPAAGWVRDGDSMPYDLNVSSDATSVSAYWNGFSDLESGIGSLLISVRRTPLGSADSLTVASERLAGDEKGILWTNVQFEDGDRIVVNVAVVNGAGLTTTVYSDGFLIDTTPPEFVYVYDGLASDGDIEFQANDSRIDVTWKSVDEESEIVYYEVAVFQLASGSRSRIWPPVADENPSVERVSGGNASSWSKVGIPLTSGAKYVVSVTAVNAAGLMANQETNGVVIDSFPPTLGSVAILNSVQDDGDTVVVSQSDLLQVSWSAAFDDESYVSEYSVDVVEDPSGVSVSSSGTFSSVGLKTSVVIGQLNLQRGDIVNGSLYRVAVRAKDAAGNLSPIMKSKKVKVVLGDTAGIVRDGPDDLVDLEFSYGEASAVTITFQGFVSEACEIDRYEWAIGYGDVTNPAALEKLQSFTTSGVVVTEWAATRDRPGSGRAQALLPGLAEIGEPIRVTIRAVTMCGKVFQATSDGILYDATESDISFTQFGSRSSNGNGRQGSTYFSKAFPVSASWDVVDDDGRAKSVSYFSAGSYPGGDDLKETTESSFFRIEDGEVVSASDGLPTFITASVWNEAGFRSEARSQAVVVDETRPEVGEVDCPSVVSSARATLRCSWSGFHDPQSGVDYFQYSIGYHKGDDAVKSLTRLPATASYLTTDKLNFDGSRKIYVTVKVVNLVGLSASGFSNAIQVDTSPPTQGWIQVKADVAYVSGNITLPRYTDSCITLPDSLFVSWEGFDDPESSLVRQELGLGSIKGADDVNAFVVLGPDVSQYTFWDVDFSSFVDKRFFVTLRVYNDIGLYSQAIHAGLVYSPTPTSKSAFVYDISGGETDVDFQTSTSTVAASWDFGTMCPMRELQWEIRRADNAVALPKNEIAVDRRSDSYDRLTLRDKETFRSIIYAKDALNRTVSLKSDGVAIAVKTPKPGTVRDGSTTGKDIDFQSSGSTISANWDAFGDSEASQRIQRYEVAVGLDRRYLATKSSVVPFTDVGLNTSHIFAQLKLTAKAVRYYVTVRGYSASGAWTDSTSDGVFVGYAEGIKAGDITVPRYQGMTDELTVHWEEFHSDESIERYEFAVGRNAYNRTVLKSFCNDLKSDQSSLFDVVGFQGVGIDTVVTLTGISLRHNETYFVAVRAIDRAGHCLVATSNKSLLVDTTPPETGVVLVGNDVKNVVGKPRKLAFTGSASDLKLSLARFRDMESGIDVYRVRLFEWKECGNYSSAAMTPVGDEVALKEEDVGDYTFLRTGLEKSKAYVVKIEVVNQAGLSSVTYSSPIVFDATDPVRGEVKDGADWSKDVGYQSRLDRVDGVFTYALTRPDSDDDPCLNVKTFKLESADSSWTSLSQYGLLGVPGEQNLEYRPAQVQYGLGGANITLESDTGKTQTLSGAYSTPIGVSGRRGTIRFTMRAAIALASLKDHSITSAVFWNGPNGTLGDFNPHKTNVTGITYDAMGMQIRPAHTAADGSAVPQQILLWTRFANGTSDHQTIYLPLEIDLTAQFHQFSFLFSTDRTTVDSKSSVVVSLDGDRLAVLHNIPDLTETTKLIFHIWNKDGYRAPVIDPSLPPKATMFIKDVSISTTSNNPCDYGSPFYDWESPIVEFQAGVGSRSFSDDVRKFQIIHYPCRACVQTPCSISDCDANCTSLHPRNFSFTLDGLRLSPFANLTTFVQPDILPLDTNYRQPAVYFVTIRAISASGRSIVASSNGITIDVTPPIVVSIEHIDTAWDLFEPTRHQSSNTTIALRWRFYDLESFVVDYQWAVGSAYGASDLQDFESVGLKTFAANDRLVGIIQDNGTYYASVAATNGAGLVAVAHSLGVTYVASGLDPSVVNQTVDILARFSIETGKNVSVEVDVERIKKTDRLGVSWGALSGLVDSIYWQIGTERGGADVLPEMDVGFAGGSQALIENASLILNGAVVGRMTELIARVKPDYSETENFFRLEPGRVTYHRVKVCDLSHQCVDVLPRPVVVIRDDDVLDVSTEGEDLSLEVTNFGSDEPSADQADRRHSVAVETSGGMQPGGLVAIGMLSSQSVKDRYSPEVPYVSNFYETKTETARHMAGRLTDLAGPSFFVSLANQEELQGPLLLNASFDRTLAWDDADPRLVFWDSDSTPSRWIEVSASCGIPDEVDYIQGKILSRMCSDIPVSSDYARRRRRREADNSTMIATNATSFLNRETQFAVAKVLNDTVNTPPQLTLPPDGLTLPEDVGTGSSTFQITYTDAEKDDVGYFIESIPRFGTATIERDTGLFSYRPCSDCIGTDQVRIRITEIPFADHEALSDEAVLTVRITNVDDLPSMFLYDGSDGNIVNPGISVIAYVEANRTTAVRAARIAAYDVDGVNDDLNFKATPLHGSVNASVWLDAVGPPDALPVDWSSANLSAGNFIGDLTFLAADLMYKPGDSLVDEIKVSARHLEGTFSPVYTVSVVVLPNPCLNDGECGGSVTDPNCTDLVARQTGFDGYACKCRKGYRGTYCEEQITPSPSPTPRACPVGVPTVHCEIDPCNDAYCPSHPLANCTANYCGACTAEWFVGSQQIQCSATGSGICNQPVDGASCSGVECPCEPEQRPCPADSVYILKRSSDCCVQWECSCPNGSCPYGVQCGEGVQPNPEWRGHGSPGRCCPRYNYTDVDECGDDAKGGCQGECVNTPHSYYCICPDGRTLAEDKFSCGVCMYNGKEYKLHDRTPFGSKHWCTCSMDGKSLERWHCVSAPETTGCISAGVEYWPGDVISQEGNVWVCSNTDYGVQWIRR